MVVKNSTLCSEEQMLDSIISKDLDTVLTFLDILIMKRLGYRSETYCWELSNVAVYNADKKEIRETIEKKKIDSVELFNEGLREISSGKSYYKLGSTCKHYYDKGIFYKKEGLIQKIDFEGWTTVRSLNLDHMKGPGLKITGADFYVWGSRWGDRKTVPNPNSCFVDKIGVPKKKPIKKLSLSELSKILSKKS